MRRQLCLVLAIVACLYLFSQVASARLVEDWSYERLFKEADLVVIATAKSNDESSDKFTDKRWPVEFTGLNTTFEVKQVLKGENTECKIKVLHFKYGKVRKEKDREKPKAGEPNIVEIIDGPAFVSFRTAEIKIVIKDLLATTVQPDYLLFLKKRKDGRYEPVSGRIDPGFSVRELLRPLP